jgi:hypothetical protein
LVRLCFLSILYNVEQLDGFKGRLLAFIKVDVLIRFEYSVFGAAWAFLYIIFFCQRDSIGGHPERDRSDVVV